MDRPEFQDVLSAWHRELESRGRSPNLRWAFRENLALIPPDASGEFGVLFQTEQPLVSTAAVADVYSRRRSQPEVVLQLLVATAEYSLCTLLFDSYESDEESPRPGLGVYFLTEPYRRFEEAPASDPRFGEEPSHLSGLDFVPLLAHV